MHHLSDEPHTTLEHYRDRDCTSFQDLVEQVAPNLHILIFPENDSVDEKFEQPFDIEKEEHAFKAVTLPKPTHKEWGSMFEDKDSSIQKTSKERNQTANTEFLTQFSEELHKFYIHTPNQALTQSFLEYHFDKLSQRQKKLADQQLEAAFSETFSSSLTEPLSDEEDMREAYAKVKAKKTTASAKPTKSTSEHIQDYFAHLAKSKLKPLCQHSQKRRSVQRRASKV